MSVCVCLNQRFIDDLLRLDDVFFVTSHQVVEWMREPTPLNETKNFVPWQCKNRHLEPSEMACELPNSCKLFSKVLQSYRYLHTCFECPKQYPWLRNEFGSEWEGWRERVSSTSRTRSSRVVTHYALIAQRVTLCKKISAFIFYKSYKSLHTCMYIQTRAGVYAYASRVYRTDLILTRLSFLDSWREVARENVNVTRNVTFVRNKLYLFSSSETERRKPGVNQAKFSFPIPNDIY